MFGLSRNLIFFCTFAATAIGENVAFAFAPASRLQVVQRNNLVLEKGSTAFKYSNMQRQPSLSMSAADDQDKKLPMLLDIGTKGGAIFLSLLLFIFPIVIYEVATLGFGIDGIEAGKWIGVGFTFFTTVLWVGSYVFRVATKDMTYVSGGIKDVCFGQY
jgi:hypothetical protein